MKVVVAVAALLLSSTLAHAGDSYSFDIGGRSLELALQRLVADGKLDALPLNGSVAAVSCGVVDGEPLLDLNYPEDSNAEVDMNVVMTGDGGLVEVQATGERTPLSRTSLDALLELAASGIEQLRAAQRAAVDGAVSTV